MIQENKESDNEYDKKIKQMIEKKDLFIFDIDSICYMVDEVTGKIQEYPFEEIDPYNAYEYFESENSYMFIITNNSKGYLKYKNILQEILDNIKV